MCSSVEKVYMSQDKLPLTSGTVHTTVLIQVPALNFRRNHNTQEKGIFNVVCLFFPIALKFPEGRVSVMLMELNDVNSFQI